ncbi:hypothetical protein Patl1_29153 [Pistacia atlantica]|uniref:Uncharacterized protein n=1 Tax=Pistacia atlantica TaxID=434234 RepID=A0ACC1BBR4_9ROSI|nr:hypothetical protein Patl1_29153 [Pistacia atlantica]
MNNMVSLLTDNIQLILDALRSSTVVEVQGDKIRKRNDWMRWIIPPGQFSSVPSGKSSQDKLASNFRNTANHNNTSISRSPSGDLSAGIGQVSLQGGFDRSNSAGNTNE